MTSYCSCTATQGILCRLRCSKAIARHPAFISQLRGTAQVAKGGDTSPFDPRGRLSCALKDNDQSEYMTGDGTLKNSRRLALSAPTGLDRSRKVAGSVKSSASES